MGPPSGALMRSEETFEKEMLGAWCWDTDAKELVLECCKIGPVTTSKS